MWSLPRPFLPCVPHPSPLDFQFFALCYPEMRENRQGKRVYQGTVYPHFHGIAFFREGGKFLLSLLPVREGSNNRLEE